MPRPSEERLKQWRNLPALDVLLALADHAKADPTYVPVKDKSSSRWYASVRGTDFELLLTGSRFFDQGLVKGGAGAIDLAMHLTRLPFKAVVNLLEELEL